MLLRSGHLAALTVTARRSGKGQTDARSRNVEEAGVVQQVNNFTLSKKNCLICSFSVGLCFHEQAAARKNEHINNARFGREEICIVLLHSERLIAATAAAL